MDCGPFRVYNGLADNYTVQVQALHNSTAFTCTDRPLAKPTVALSKEMQQLKRDASKAPPPKGRRNLNSKEFLGTSKCILKCAALFIKCASVAGKHEPQIPKNKGKLTGLICTGALSHDFCPIAGDEKRPTDYSYSIWQGNGNTKIEPTDIQSLPVKEYGACMLSHVCGVVHHANSSRTFIIVSWSSSHRRWKMAPVVV